jgi:hypothetical protein
MTDYLSHAPYFVLNNLCPSKALCFDPGLRYTLCSIDIAEAMELRQPIVDSLRWMSSDIYTTTIYINLFQTRSEQQPDIEYQICLSRPLSRMSDSNRLKEIHLGTPYGLKVLVRVTEERRHIETYGCDRW